MSEPKPEFRITPRGFTFAEIPLQDGGLLTVQPASHLPDSSGTEPVYAGLWLRKGEHGDSIRLDRRQAAELAKIIIQWLATGFVEP
jgi:hypothetical protein